MSIGYLDWSDCDSCNHYDEDKNGCEKGVWNNLKVYLEFDGDYVDCSEYEEAE